MIWLQTYIRNRPQNHVCVGSKIQLEGLDVVLTTSSALVLRYVLSRCASLVMDVCSADGHGLRYHQLGDGHSCSHNCSQQQMRFSANRLWGSPLQTFPMSSDDQPAKFAMIQDSATSAIHFVKYTQVWEILLLLS